MNRPLLPRLAAACGIIFPIAMFLAVGNGNNFALGAPSPRPGRSSSSSPSSPTSAACFAQLRATMAGFPRSALVAGTSGVLLKLVSHAPELAIHQDHIAKGTPLYNALDHTAGAATSLCLYPLAIYAAAVAVIVLRERALPRWIGFIAALTAGALVINGGFVFAGFVPALLLFLLWTLATAVVLLRRTWVASTQVAYAT